MTVSVKRERIRQFLSGEPMTEGVPAGFSQHFRADKRFGDLAFQEQMEYIQKTDMDVMKVMFDNIYPKIEFIDEPDSWLRVPQFNQKNPVFSNQLELTKRLCDKAGGDMFILHTLFAPFVSAGNATMPIMRWGDRVTDHIIRKPEALASAMEGIIQVLAEFAQNLAEAGVDGFYVSVQTMEQPRFVDDVQKNWIKPYDILFLKALQRTGKKVFVHICGSRIHLEHFYDYPGDAFNLAFSSNDITMKEAAERFGRPIMGGLKNVGFFENSSEEDIRKTCREVLAKGPKGMMLGADCTVPAYVPPKRLQWAVDEAHNWVY